MHRRLSRTLRVAAASLGWACSFGCPNRREQTVPVPITRAQRDAIYEMVISRLTAIGDLWLSVDRRDFATAQLEPSRLRVPSLPRPELRVRELRLGLGPATWVARQLTVRRIGSAASPRESTFRLCGSGAPATAPAELLASLGYRPPAVAGRSVTDPVIRTRSPATPVPPRRSQRLGTVA
jgi:hypothetical protein